jgi:SpoVK/Ycf46/Vps4 family AAA+-type ATPase
VCATNFIRALDSAFLRHGRFDYVIPIGLPDRQAREAMWQRFIPAAVVDDVDVEQLVDRTKGFSPADIEFAARSASQRALEKSVYGNGDDGGLASAGGVAVREAARKGPTTQDYLDAIADTRTTVSDDVHEEFLEDIDALGRV